MNFRWFTDFSKNVCTDRCCIHDRYKLSTLDYRSVKPINESNEINGLIPTLDMVAFGQMKIVVIFVV